MTTLLTINAAVTWLVFIPVLFLLFGLVKRYNALEIAGNGHGFDYQQLAVDGARVADGVSAGAFTATAQNNRVVTQEDFAGTNTAFVFLSPACKPCRDKMPHLNEMYSSVRDGGANLVVVTIDPEVSADDFANQFSATMPVLAAPQPENPFAEDYQVESFPGFCIVRPDGKLAAAGSLHNQYWRDQLNILWE